MLIYGSKNLVSLNKQYFSHSKLTIRFLILFFKGKLVLVINLFLVLFLSFSYWILILKASQSLNRSILPKLSTQTERTSAWQSFQSELFHTYKTLSAWGKTQRERKIIPKNQIIFISLFDFTILCESKGKKNKHLIYT